MHACIHTPTLKHAYSRMHIHTHTYTNTRVLILVLILNILLVLKQIVRIFPQISEAIKFS